MLIEIDERQHATILAALRHYQTHDCNCGAELDEIATNAGAFEPLDVEEVDELCEHINCGYKDEPPVKYYVVEIKDHQDYETHGPYDSELEQHRAAVIAWNSRMFNRDEDALLFLDVRGDANYCLVPRDFLENPSGELKRLKEVEEQENQGDRLASKIKCYIQGGGANCLFCGDISVTGDSYDEEGGVITQEISCNVCDASWQNVYTLTKVNVTEGGFVNLENGTKAFIGDEVHWDDPDNGICSGVRTLAKIINDDVVLLRDASGGETEAFVQELS